MNAAIFERVRGIAADVFGVKRAALHAASSPETVESWDSVQHLNLTLALEESFGFQFSPEEMDGMKTLGQIAALVEAKAESKTGA